MTRLEDKILTRIDDRQLQRFQVDLKSSRTDSRSPEWDRALSVPQFVRRELVDQVDQVPVTDLPDEWDTTEEEIRDFFRRQLRDDDWDIDEITSDAAEEFDVNEGWAFTKTREFLNVLVNASRMRGYNERGVDGNEYRWVGPDDDNNHPACDWLREQTEEGVTWDQMQRLFGQARSRFVDDPPANPLIMHDWCRHQIKQKYNR